MKVRSAVIAAAAGLFGAGLAIAVPATAGTHGGYGSPSPTATATQLPTTTPTPTPTQLPTTPPVVNPFAGCNFSTTFAFTFDPARGRFVREAVPAIVCDTPGARPRVFDLVRQGR